MSVASQLILMFTGTVIAALAAWVAALSLHSAPRPVQRHGVTVVMLIGFVLTLGGCVVFYIELENNTPKPASAAVAPCADIGGQSGGVNHILNSSLCRLHGDGPVPNDSPWDWYWNKHAQLSQGYHGTSQPDNWMIPVWNAAADPDPVRFLGLLALVGLVGWETWQVAWRLSDIFIADNSPTPRP